MKVAYFLQGFLGVGGVVAWVSWILGFYKSEFLSQQGFTSPLLLIISIISFGFTGVLSVLIHIAKKEHNG